MDNLLNELADILEVDNVSNDDVLANFECWDSLTVLSIIALCSENYNITISAKQVADSYSVGGLINFIKSKGNE